MIFDVLTTFPSMFEGPVSESIIKRAIEKGLVDIRIHDLRNWTTDKHRTTDNYPYGGGAGMVMKPEPIFAAVKDLIGTDNKDTPSEVILMTPAGETFNQKIAEELSARSHLILICGHYEGVDERVRERLVTREISIGDFVLSGGELPAMVIIDAVTRLVPSVIDPESIADESHTSGLLEYPQYTRPALFQDMEVPGVLLSGNHAAIAKWRLEESIKRTRERRPDMYERWFHQKKDET